ncbi:hypothetical protein [Ammoniphilus sp. YIM 78166]|uniref:hypothetical protein n=1 Tax=Ammoniphilus sp. YIM 78166 TaxID=1644106 RepID=UPI00106F99AB|nr:hypothetical protein [Ammoniphilus sp. YIM 78166]
MKLFEEFKTKKLFYIWNFILACMVLSFLLFRGWIYQGGFLYFYIFLTLAITMTPFVVFKKEYDGYKRLTGTLLIIVALVVGYRGYVDIPAFVKDDLITVQGIPKELEKTGSKMTRKLYVTIENVKLALPSGVEDDLKDRWVIVEYLPYSKTVINYEILSIEETSKKVNNGDKNHVF